MEPIRLDLNEMPFAPPAEFTSVIQESIHRLNRYTEPGELRQLQQLIAGYTGVSEKHIIIGPGTELLLRELILCFAGERAVVTVTPSFQPTIQTARAFSPQIHTIRLCCFPEFLLKKEPLLEELQGPTLVIIDNPNNPTGQLLIDREVLRAILDTPETLLVIDEAYYEFSGSTCADLLNDYPNLAITRTFDKAFGLAGARIGYLLAGDSFLSAFSTFPRFLPRIGVQLSINALERSDYMKKNVEIIKEERERILQELERLHFGVCKSSTNFVLLRTEIGSFAGRLYEFGVLVSDMTAQLGPGYVRISVGTPQENDKLLDICEDLVNQEE